MGERQQFFQNLFDEIEAMEQIEGFKVPSDGGFMANYNNRNERLRVTTEPGSHTQTGSAWPTGPRRTAISTLGC